MSIPDSRPALDEAVVRRLLHAASSEPSFIATEVAKRMASRLDYIRIDAGHVLDAHSNPPVNWDDLHARYPKARMTALQLAPGSAIQPTLRTARGLVRLPRWLARGLRVDQVCAALGSAPLQTGCVDLVFSNLALHWHSEPHRVFPDWSRVLRPGGLVMFTAFGPDTLAEVRRAFGTIDRAPHVVTFTDMHDYGDMLVHAGFATPVMDMETITLTYSTEDHLWADVRALGGNPLAARRRGLLGRHAAERLSAALREERAPDGRFRLSFEVIYGHAWKGVPRTTADGRAIVKRMDRPPA